MRKSVLISLTLLFLLGCNRHRSEMFSNGVLDLKLTYGDWVNHGRPKNYDLASFIQPQGTNLTLFNFTNQVSASYKTSQCLFGARNTAWPKGTRAIADDGTILWIRDRDQKVTLSPERRGVSP